MENAFVKPSAPPAISHNTLWRFLPLFPSLSHSSRAAEVRLNAAAASAGPARRHSLRPSRRPHDHPARNPARSASAVKLRHPRLASPPSSALLLLLPSVGVTVVRFRAAIFARSRLGHWLRSLAAVAGAPAVRVGAKGGVAVRGTFSEESTIPAVTTESDPGYADAAAGGANGLHDAWRGAGGAADFDVGQHGRELVVRGGRCGKKRCRCFGKESNQRQPGEKFVEIKLEGFRDDEEVHPTSAKSRPHAVQPNLTRASSRGCVRVWGRQPRLQLQPSMQFHLRHEKSPPCSAWHEIRTVSSILFPFPCPAPG